MGAEPESSAEAQRRADRIRVLREELAELESAGVLTLSAEQRSGFDAWSEATLARWAARFDVDVTASEKRVSWGMRIASTLGGVAFFVAVVLFFTRYWGFLGTSAQVSLAVAAPLAALAATEWMSRRERTLYFTGLLALVALACFFMDLALVGGVFHIASSEASLLAWGAFAMLLAYQYGLRPMLVAGLATLLLWGSAFLTARLGHSWMQFLDRPEHFAVAGAVAFSVPLWLRHRRNSDFPAVYRLAGALALFVALLTLSLDGSCSYLPFEVKAVEQVYEALGLIATVGAIAWGVRRQWDGVVHSASLFFVLFLYARLHRWFWEAWPKYLFFALIGGLAIVLVVVFKKLRERMKREAAR